MPTAILKNAEAFDFTTLDGERLELFGELASWSDEVKTGIVEKQVVRRAGALHQKMGAPPRKFGAKCVIMGQNVTARYRRLCDMSAGDLTSAYGKTGGDPAVVDAMLGTLQAMLQQQQSTNALLKDQVAAGIAERLQRTPLMIRQQAPANKEGGN